MDFEFREEEIAFREEVVEFAEKELPPDWDEKTLYWPGGYGTLAQMETEFKEFTQQFHHKLGKKGWLSLGWPEEYGGMNSWIKHAIVDEVMSYYRAPYGGIATWISGPTIIEVGSEKMKKQWLARIASGEATFWLGYSEPDAGSDLGSLRTTALDKGDYFLVNGQKTWSTGAHVTDYAWLLAKTNLEAPKHKSATLMIVDNKTPGITIRPILNVLGVHSFNEVFFDNVKVPKENVIGEINNGFYSVMRALAYERLIMGMGAFKRVLEELIHYVKTTQYNGELLAKNPLVRNKIAAIAIEIEVLYGFYWRTAHQMDRGKFSDNEAAVLKLFGTELSRSIAGTAMDILGLYGQLDRGSKWAPILNGWICIGYLDSISGPIGAGTSEVQRGIIATRELGLPRV
jgi:alkylation response protein AidB-like acyl-CoA dehydrogenase